jgi:hypothetical protein
MNTTTANANTTIRLQESGLVKATIGYDGTNDGLILTTGGFTAGNGIFIDDSQNIGIGTTSPDTILNLNKTGGAIIRLQSGVTNTSDGLYGGIEWYNTDPTTDGPEVVSNIMSYQNDANGRGGYITFGTTNGFDGVGSPSERMRIDSSGNVGIGTTSLSYKLDINETGTSTYVIHAQKSGTSLGGLYVDASSNAEFYLKASGNSTQVLLNTDGNSYLNGGNVGIGTTSPVNKLSVAGSVDADTFISIQGIDTGNPAAGNDELRVSGYGIMANRGALYVTNANTASGANIQFGVGGSHSLATKMMINSSGRVGIGTISPSSRLSISGSQAAIDITRGNSGDSKWEFSSDSTALYFSEMSTGTRAYMMTIKETTGNVGIGTTSPSSKLHVTDGGTLPTISGTYLISATSASNAGIQINAGNTSASIIAFGDTNSQDVGVIRYDHSDNHMRFNTNATEAMRITSGGDVLFGTTSLPNGTSVYGAAFQDLSNNRMGLRTASSSTATSNLIFFYNPNGLVGSISTNGSATTYTTSSDYRLKENVVELTGALDRISQLKPSRFNFIADADKTVDGFLAHEVQEIVPEAITGEKDAVDEEGNAIYQGIDQAKLVPLLVGAIQELKAEIELLKTQINN